MKTRLKQGNQWVDGDTVDFEPLREGWNEYRTSDGALIRMKQAVTQITRLEGQIDSMGRPMYLVESQTLMTVTPPDGPRP